MLILWEILQGKNCSGYIKSCFSAIVDIYKLKFSCDYLMHNILYYKDFFKGKWIC